tara:strand:- start:754 stop:1170 length:417 start_codon:yes stop_codon:yes gene_type:complete
MTKTLAQIKADVKEYGDDFATEVAEWAGLEANLEWDKAKKIVTNIDEQGFQLICHAQQNAWDSVEVGEWEFSLTLNGEDTGVTQLPSVDKFNNGNAAYYMACIATLRTIIEDMHSDNYSKDECGVTTTPDDLCAALGW